MSWSKSKGSGSSGDTHTNKSVLDKLSEAGGSLSYSGQPIAKSSEIGIKSTDIDPAGKATGKILEVGSSGKLIYSTKPTGGTGGTGESELVPLMIKTVPSVNLLDYSKAELGGYYDMTSGLWQTAPVNDSAPLTVVTQGTTYTKSFSGHITYWDANITFISGANSKTFTVPTGTNIKYVRFSMYDSAPTTKDKWMLVEGSTLPVDFVPYSSLHYTMPEQYFSFDTKVAGIDKVTALEKANGIGYLRLPIYYKSTTNQATHPAPLYFPNKWNGFKYWMSITPYEWEYEEKEDPCVIVSNDLINWKSLTPSNIPLDVKANHPDCGHLSDGTLVYRADTNTLECWYRSNTIGNVDEIIYRRTTTDGVNWTPVQELFKSLGSYNQAMCPVVLFEENIYKIWVVAVGKLKYYESTTGSNWTFIRDINFQGAPANIWHIDLKHTAKGYELYFCCQYLNPYLCYAYSTDNITYSKVETVIKGSLGGFDQMIYKPGFIDVDGIRYIYYGGIHQRTAKTTASTINGWYIGLSKCLVSEPTILRGVNLAGTLVLEEKVEI